MVRQLPQGTRCGLEENPASGRCVGPVASGAEEDPDRVGCGDRPAVRDEGHRADRERRHHQRGGHPPRIRSNGFAGGPSRGGRPSGIRQRRHSGDGPHSIRRACDRPPMVPDSVWEDRRIGSLKTSRPPPSSVAAVEIEGRADWLLHDWLERGGGTVHAGQQHREGRRRPGPWAPPGVGAAHRGSHGLVRLDRRTRPDRDPTVGRAPFHYDYTDIINSGRFLEIGPWSPGTSRSSVAGFSGPRSRTGSRTATTAASPSSRRNRKSRCTPRAETPASFIDRSTSTRSGERSSRSSQVAYGMWKAFAAERRLPWLPVGTFEVAVRPDQVSRLEKY